jgi:hypothetical protein
MDNPLLSWALIGGIALLGAILLGGFLQKGCGIFLFIVATLAAVGICYLGAWLHGWIGLFIAVLVVGMGGALAGGKIGGSRGAKVVALLWLLFSSSALVGYWIGDAPGVVVVSLATMILFWATLRLFSGYLLPHEASPPDRSERTAAFRSLLTYSLGTNFPYLVMKGRELEERVAGKPYQSFFAGPGVVLTGCDHIVVLTNGANMRVARAPGLVFTQRFEVVHCTVDLRPQLRSFFVEAYTQDGIAVRVEILVPFRVGWGGRKPACEEPFPASREDIFSAVRNEPVEQGQNQKRNWDDLIEIHAARIMRDIICGYDFDELCLATGAMVEKRPVDDDIVKRYRDDEQAFVGDDQDDPRVKIRNEFIDRLTFEMSELGIEVLDGWISSLLPLDRAVTRQRIDNWRTKWQNRMVLVEADREARRTRLREQARNEVERDLLAAASDMLSESLVRGQDMSDELLAASVVASLERMAENPNVRQLLSGETIPRLAYLRAQGRAISPAGPAKGTGE